LRARRQVSALARELCFFAHSLQPSPTIRIPRKLPREAKVSTQAERKAKKRISGRPEIL
jgi:hypothetical protein